MPKPNDDLFQRLRRAGIRKPVAKALSELTEDAGKKAIGVGTKAVAELRALADELEKRLPAPVPAAKPAVTAPARRRTAPKAEVVTPARRRAAASATRTSARQPAAPARKPAAPRARKPAARAAAASAPAAPRGENKAKILAALKAGPGTASEVGQATGISAATVSAALTRLARSGEVVKATRGYALPS